MRKASLLLGIVAAAALAGTLAAPMAWAQSAVKPGGAIGGGGASASNGYLVPVGAIGGAAAVSASAGYRLYGGPAAAFPTGPAIARPITQPAAVGTDALLTAQVSGGGNIALTLYYRLAGEAAGAYRSVAMTSEDNLNFQAVVPAADVGVRGLEYFIYGIQNGGVATSPYLSPRENPVQLAARLDNTPVLNLYDQAFRMFGMSFNVVPNSVSAIFNDDLGDTNTTQWRLGRWNDALGAYQNYYDVGPIYRGRGYWIIARGDKQVRASGTSAFQDTTVGPGKYAKIVLQPGWNQIANPFAFTVSWAGRRAETGVGSTLWSWNGASYDPATVLYGFMGYWVENTADVARLLLIPYEEAVVMKAADASASPAPKAGDDGWRLGLTLTAGDLRDTSTEIGAAAEATDGLDALDYGKPPCPPGRFVALGVLASADGSRPKRLAGDFRAPSAAGWRFPLLVQGFEAGAATLRLAGADRLPAACKAALVDPRTGTAYDLGGDGAIVLPHLPTPEGVRYDLVVGPEAWVDGEVGPTTTMPRRHALEACYPNPFNPLTKIAFELPAPARARLEVLDVAGRRVAVLLDEPRAGGRHVVEWDGRDAQGRGVASGTYYYRLSADDFTRTRSMTLLK